MHAAAAPPTIRPELTPDWSLYDAADMQLREAAQLLQQALGADSVEQEEAQWTAIIDKYGGLKDNWVPDLVGRAYGNRGNARSRQGKWASALEDYDQAAVLCPWSVDPVLNRCVCVCVWRLLCVGCMGWWLASSNTRLAGGLPCCVQAPRLCWPTLVGRRCLAPCCVRLQAATDVPSVPTKQHPPPAVCEQGCGTGVSGPL